MEPSSSVDTKAGAMGWLGCPSPSHPRNSSDPPDKTLPAFYLGDLAEYLDDKESMDKKVTVGICAMAKKSNSKPMKEIVRRLANFSRIQIVIFEEDVILNHPIEDWPIVNALISFFSSGFPLDKAIAYKNLREPFVVNDLEMQYILQDRVLVYRMLEQHNIPHPRYAVLNRQQDPDCKVIETEDSIEINGQQHQKPFVEKPISAEDHNIYIYFPQAAGGGSTRLFRKVKDRSSMYSHTSHVRRNGAYLYEDFMPTDGTDVKVYTVGTDYQHAEARKSPCLDGKVERDQDGKEVRYPVLLSASEKLIARKVVMAFGQNVCGFDLLRANGKCYVCDVNGFSFVKTSSKYYDDCARILGTMILRAVCPSLHIPCPIGPAPEDVPVVPTTSGMMMELRCVVALIRHGDRTPKQKMKMEVKHKLFFELFEKYGGFRNGHLKLKRPKQLQEVLDIVRQLLASSSTTTDPDLQDKKAKLQQMKLVLEMYGHFSGINRKVQLKYQPQGRPKRSSSEEVPLDARFPEELCIRRRCSGYEFTGIHRKVQLKYQPLGRPHASSSDDETPRDPSLLLILKWGGELTPAGRIQAENLGKAFRTLYPGGQGQFEAPGLGFLRLHSTFRHDLKIYASDEGRVQMTAAAFTKGLLALEGELTPILVQMVKSANTNGLLDGEGKTSKSQIVVKEKLKEVFNQEKDFDEEDVVKLNPTDALALSNAMEFVKNPHTMCQHIHQMIRELTAKIRSLKVELKSRELPLYNGESWELLIRRWAKLEKDFMLKNGQFEISKIPDIYDCIKYDLQHNHKTLQYERANELFMCSKALADIVIPQEYGITVEEKLHIAQNYCSAFLRKIRSDFLQCINNPNVDEDTTRLDSRYSKGVASPERFVRTRLYFTSESHIHSMLNMLRYGNLFEEGTDSQWERALSFLDATAELNYMSQIVFMLFEDPSKPMDSDDRYHMELHFSPGAYTSCDEPTEPRGMGYRPKHPPQQSQVDVANDSLKGSARLVSAFSGPFPATSKRHSRLETGGTDLDDIHEADMFEFGSQPTSPDPQSKGSSSPKSSASTPKASTPGRPPGSPDPNIPEWDWGEESTGTVSRTASTVGVTENTDGKEKKTSDDTLQAAVSDDFEVDAKAGDRASATPSFGKQRPSSPIAINKASTSAANADLLSPDLCKLSLEEKRSRSFEDKNDKNGEASTSSIHRNYKTVHLPLHTGIHSRHSLPSVFSFGLSLSGLRGGESHKDEDEDRGVPAPDQKVPDITYSTWHSQDSVDSDVLHLVHKYNQLLKGQLQSRGSLEGFSYVPQLHPLETLHNNLTSRQMDDFLGRVTTNRFPMPAFSPSFCEGRPTLMLASPSRFTQSLSYPPSSNSSSGPSSPSSVPAHVDFLSNFRAYIERQQKEEGTCVDSDTTDLGAPKRPGSQCEKCPPTPPPSPRITGEQEQSCSNAPTPGGGNSNANNNSASSSDPESGRSGNKKCSGQTGCAGNGKAISGTHSLPAAIGNALIKSGAIPGALSMPANIGSQHGASQHGGAGKDCSDGPNTSGTQNDIISSTQKESTSKGDCGISIGELSASVAFTPVKNASHEKQGIPSPLQKESGLCEGGGNCQTTQTDSQKSASSSSQTVPSTKPSSQKPKKTFTVSRIDNDPAFKAPTSPSSITPPVNTKDDESLK